MAIYTIDDSKNSVNPTNRYSRGDTSITTVPQTKLFSRYALGSFINSTQNLTNLLPFSVEPINIYDYYYLNIQEQYFFNQYIYKDNNANLKLKYGVAKSRIAFPINN